MKTILLITLGILLNINLANSQCPNGCNPNTGTMAITYTPQCYGENYEFTISGVYDYANWCDLTYYWNYNGTYQASYAYPQDYCVEFHSYCYHSNPTVSNNPNECGIGNVPCVICHTTTSLNSHTVSIHLDSIPCLISVSATKQDCSDYRCSDGELTVSVSTNTCNGAEVYVNGNWIHLDNGQSHTFSNLPAGTYYVDAYSNPGGCTDSKQIIIEEPDCHVTADFIITPASGYSCMDGEIEANGYSSECMQYYMWMVHLESSTTYWFWNETQSQFSYYPNFNNDHFSVAGLPSGHFQVHLQTIDYVCETTYDLIITPDCESTQWFTQTDSTSYFCQLGTIANHCITNSCQGWTSKLMTLEGTLIANYQSMLSGDSIVYNNLSPDTFLLFTNISNYFTYYGDSVCNFVDTIIIHPKPCVSPMSFTIDPALAMDCSDGKIIATLQDSCQDWWFTILSSDSMIFFGATPYWWDMQFYWPLNAEGKHEREFILPEGKYYLRNYKVGYDFDGHIHECTAWDTLMVTCDSSTVDFTIQTYIQGYYVGGGMMNSPLDLSANNKSDSLTLTLSETWYPFSKIFTTKSILALNGMTTFQVPLYFLQQPYYLVINHRNSLETWSSLPVQLMASGIYNFTLSPLQSYGNMLADLGDGNYAIWSGDINQDGAINEYDLTELETSSWNFITGYTLPDLTGDGVVESADYSLLENNILMNISIHRP